MLTLYLLILSCNSSKSPYKTQLSFRSHQLFVQVNKKLHKPKCKPFHTLRMDLFQKVNSLQVPFSTTLALRTHQTLLHNANKPARSQSVASKTLNQIMQLGIGHRKHGILSACSQHHNLKKQVSKGTTSKKTVSGKQK